MDYARFSRLVIIIRYDGGWGIKHGEEEDNEQDSHSRNSLK